MLRLKSKKQKGAFFEQNFLRIRDCQPLSSDFLKEQRYLYILGTPGSTLHGYLSKILARSCQDLGKFLAKIVTRYCQELQDAMVRSYQESHVSKKNLTKKPNMARKI